MKRYDPAAEILAAVGAAKISRTIRANFRDGRSAVYTMAMFGLLSTDPDVKNIIDAQTGEILYSAGV